jgi:hypothetical protein
MGIANASLPDIDDLRRRLAQAEEDLETERAASEAGHTLREQGRLLSGTSSSAHTIEALESRVEQLRTDIATLTAGTAWRARGSQD